MLFAGGLKPGDTIGIIAPCGLIAREKAEEAAVGLRSLGFRVNFSKNLFRDSKGYAASVEERAEDFNGMAADPDIRMIFFGGGEIGNELLPYIRYSALQRDPKLLCSYSDGTSILNAVTAVTSLVTYYGMPPYALARPDPYNLSQLQGRVAAGERRIVKSSPWKVLRGGKCEGALIGGYLMNVALLVNSRYLPFDRSRKYLLFLEDSVRFNVPAAVSQYLSHIEQSSFFPCVSGLIFGQYTGEKSPPQPKRIDGVLKRFAARHSIPVV